MLLNDEQLNIWKEEFMVCFKILQGIFLFYS